MLLAPMSMGPVWLDGFREWTRLHGLGAKAEREGLLYNFQMSLE